MGFKVFRASCQLRHERDHTTHSELGWADSDYMEGQVDLVSRFFMGVTRVTMWVIGVIINLLIKVPMTLQV